VLMMTLRELKVTREKTKSMRYSRLTGISLLNLSMTLD
jgi:hypothetical protein